ncbi:hypothetical protein CcI49_20215 [Frankia sp. CcI49]|nr:hypothetical protein CcI49_20215 [Frankia sp. CcI49]
MPSYAELPVTPGAPPGSSWGLWGAEDRLGTLNLLTPARLAAGVATVRDHRVIPLDLPLDVPGPPLFRRSRFQHTIRALPVGRDETLSDWNPQGSSQWDGFGHVRHPRWEYYNGLPCTDHGMEHWASRGIAGRAVLVDVDRYLGAAGRPIDHASSVAVTPDDLAGALAAQGTTVETGDILLIRTGWLGWYRAGSARRRARLGEAMAEELANPGLAPGREMAAFLWDLHPAAVAVDNPAVEVWPRGWPLSRAQATSWLLDPAHCEDVFLHFLLVPLLGMALGELWDLDELARACHGDGRYECLVVSAPLHLPGGVSSPANAVALR